MDPEFIQQEFDFREETRGLEIAAAVLNAIAWFSLIAPMFQVAWLLSNRGRRQLSSCCMICALAIGGSVAEFLSTLMFIGGSNAAEWLAKDFNLDNWLSSSGNDNIGWRVVEISNILLHGTRLWVDAIEWIFLYLIMTLIFVANLTYYDTSLSTGSGSTRLFSMRWAGFGLFAAAFCIVDFAAEVLRFEDWRTFSQIAFVTSVVLRVFLLPIWLLGLAMTLPTVQKNAALGGGGSSSNVAPPSPTASAVVGQQEMELTGSQLQEQQEQQPSVLPAETEGLT